MIGVSFYAVAASTIRLVSDSLFEDTIRRQKTEAAELAGALRGRLESETADAFYVRLLQAARESGGRLLIVDGDGKV